MLDIKNNLIIQSICSQSYIFSYLSMEKLRPYLTIDFESKVYEVCGNILDNGLYHYNSEHDISILEWLDSSGEYYIDSIYYTNDITLGTHINNLFGLWDYLSDEGKLFAKEYHRSYVNAEISDRVNRINRLEREIVEAREEIDVFESLYK